MTGHPDYLSHKYSCTRYSVYYLGGYELVLSRHKSGVCEPAGSGAKNTVIPSSRVGTVYSLFIYHARIRGLSFVNLLLEYLLVLTSV